ncbi:P-loop containing nucleoside triphosphate hydrolase protein [Haematococcus lacustris]
MPTYNFKSIQVVPSAKDFIDIILSKTQRGTPTVVHNGWAIQRIRQFYMRKVKFTAANWNERLTAILDEFPKVEDMHPFYGDLLNVLYDKDHYKLALGQLNTARNLIDRLAQDYVRLVKYGDSLYRCKELKRAAMGRMCTLMKRQGPSLAYLEQVRQHMGRLPSIDPNTRSLLLCGYPNVGKSSMMNKLTKADVDVQPYAFTTKSLFVGHMDYKYLRWQVIDTPGILDRPLEERNTIEMQSITALAHLRAACLYIVDISEQCGYTIAQQAALFHSIKPLFANKPILIICNKIDTRKMEDLTADEQRTITTMVAEARRISAGTAMAVESAAGSEEEQVLMAMSTLNEEGVMQAKQVACERLLAHRVEVKVAGKRINDVLNRIHIAMPKPRDGSSRPPVIPAGVAKARARRVAGEKKKLQKHFQEENGGAGVYSMDHTQLYDLKNPDWKRDIMPELLDGHNIMDFVDPDIEAKLAELEREEEELEKAHAEELGDGMSDDDDELTEEQATDLMRIRLRKKAMIKQHRMKKGTAGRQSVMPHKADTDRSLTTSNMKASLGAMGIDTSQAVARVRSESRGRKRARSAAGGGDAAGGDDVEMSDATPKKRVHSSKSRSMSRGRSRSLAEPAPGSGLKDAIMRNKGQKMADKMQWRRNKLAKAGESDRAIQTKMPKHLFSGKMKSNGKRDRR